MTTPPSNLAAAFAKRPLDPVPAWAILFGLVAVGQRELALEWLERVTPRGALLWRAAQFPDVGPLGRDPRFQRVMDDSRPPGATDRE